MKTYIIAEVGPNHNGSLEFALEYIDALTLIGVDAIKFQLAEPKLLFSKDSKLAKYQTENTNYKTPLQMIANHQLSQNDHIKLYKKCKKNKIDYLCTGFDLQSVKFLNENFDLKYFKIASGEIFSIDILEYISKFNKPIILSTGMAKFDEISQTIKILNSNFKKNITLLHCISNYPAKINKVNLNVMNKLKELFDYPVGFSDHTETILSSIIAVSMGAIIIEKHVTFDKKLIGPDHKASSTIEEFKELVSEIRKVELIKGNKKNYISKSEIEIANVSRKSIVAKKNLKKNKILSNNDFCYKRPGTGILPIYKNKIIGKKLKKNINKDKLILLKDLI